MKRLSGLLLAATLLLPIEASADQLLPRDVPPGTSLVIADDANYVASLLKLSGEQEKLAADVTYANFSSGPLRLEAIRAGAAQYGWNIDLGAVSKIWRGGCIIRAQFLNRIADAYAATPDLPVLLTAPYFVDALTRAQDSWRSIVALAAASGIPAPAFSSSLAYYDGLRAERLPAALIQGQRDFFGAHTYKRIDKEGTFHTLWSGDRSEVEL